MNDEIYKQIRCQMCAEVTELTIPADEWAAYKGGQLIQRAIPSLSDDERELLISGICGKCFDDLFRGDPE
jgi:hypothetical protein